MVKANAAINVVIIEVSLLQEANDGPYAELALHTVDPVGDQRPGLRWQTTMFPEIWVVAKWSLCADELPRNDPHSKLGFVPGFDPFGDARQLLPDEPLPFPKERGLCRLHWHLSSAPRKPGLDWAT